MYAGHYTGMRNKGGGMELSDIACLLSNAMAASGLLVLQFVGF